MRTDVTFKNGSFWIRGKPVKNHHHMLNLLSKLGADTFNPDDWKTAVHSICPLHYVTDGDWAYVISTDLKKEVPLGNCHCGVPHDVHGTCCGWYNAKIITDESLRICDDRHPWWNRNFNDWMNQRFQTQQA